MTGLPDPSVKPLMTPMELIECGVLPHRKTAIYGAIERGEIPSIRIGSRLLIPVAELRRQWGLDLGEASPVGAA